MSEITLVRNGIELYDKEKEILRRALFGMVDGLSESDRRAWRRFWNGILRAGMGEILVIRTWMARREGFHRRHMLIETQVFQAQELFLNFEQFRMWIKIGAGFCDWMPGPGGELVPVPRSISYSKCDENEMREFHANMIAFLREPHACKFLWPALSGQEAEASMERILRSFDE